MYETDVVSQTEKLLRGLAANRNLLNRLRQNGMDYASGTPHLGGEGKEHNSGPELGCASGSETRSTAA